MFEEAQLYSPVTTGDGGEVTVHLHDGHPGADDPCYRRRRNENAASALAWQPGEPAPAIDYAETEEEVWRTVCRELARDLQQADARDPAQRGDEASVQRSNGHVDQYFNRSRRCAALLDLL